MVKYLGGKSKLARQISETILAATPYRERYIEPFIGGGAMAEKMGGHFEHALYSDSHRDCVLMWQHGLAGGEFPETVTEDEYKAWRDAEPSGVRGFVGFAGSWGGKFFGGYGRDSTGRRNFIAEGLRNIERNLAGMRGRASTSVDELDYRLSDVRAGDVVYCDPPYADTTGYTTGDFDHDEFWQVVQGWAERGAEVFVSEFIAPEWVGEPIWSKERHITAHSGFDENGKRTMRKVDALFHLNRERLEDTPC